MPRWFSKAKEPEAKEPKAKLSGLVAAGIILSFVSSLGDGPLPIPGLKSAAQIAIRVIEVSQLVIINKEECLLIGERTAELMQALIEAFQHKPETAADAHLQRDIDQFIRHLEDILRILEGFTRASLLSRIIRHVDHLNELVHCKEALDHSHKMFQVTNGIAIRLAVANQGSLVTSSQRQQDLALRQTIQAASDRQLSAITELRGLLQTQAEESPSRSTGTSREYEHENGFKIYRTTDISMGDEYRFNGKAIHDMYHASVENRAVIVRQYAPNHAHTKRFIKESQILKGIMHKSLPRFLGSSKATDGKLFLVLDQIEGNMNIVGILNGTLGRSPVEGFTLASKVVHGLSAAIAYVEDQGLSFDVPWYSPFDLRLYSTGNDWTARLVNVDFAHGCMQRPEVGTPRNTLITILKAARKQISSSTMSACVVRLWAATIRSLLWKRAVPIQDGYRSLVPIYAQAREELADLVASVVAPEEELTPNVLDALRHRAGLFSSIFLQCPGGFDLDVGELVYWEHARGQDAASLIPLGKIQGLNHLIRSTHVQESCDGEWEDHERVELPGNITRHCFKASSRVNLYLGWRLTNTTLGGLLDEAVPLDSVHRGLSPLYLVSGRRAGLGEAYFYWDPVDVDRKFCPKPIYFFHPSMPTPNTEPGYWSFEAEPQDFATARTPEDEAEIAWGQLKGYDSIEIIEIKEESGRLCLNDGGWDNPGTFEEELDRFFPLWVS